MKNSLRAVNDRFEDADFEPPPVRVVVAEGDEDVTIKVSSLPNELHHLSMRKLKLFMRMHSYG